MVIFTSWCVGSVDRRDFFIQVHVSRPPGTTKQKSAALKPDYLAASTATALTRGIWRSTAVAAILKRKTHVSRGSLIGNPFTLVQIADIRGST